MSKENIDLLRRGYEAFNRRDLDAALSLMDERIEWRDISDLPGAGTYVGHEGVRRSWEQQLETFDDFRAEPVEFADAGDHVIVTVRVGGSGKASGIGVSREVAQVWRIRDGKAVWFQGYADKAEALKAVGLAE